jgi:hypothetical protein
MRAHSASGPFLDLCRSVVPPFVLDIVKNFALTEFGEIRGGWSCKFLLLKVKEFV